MSQNRINSATIDSEARRALGRAAAASSATLSNTHSQQQPLSPPPVPGPGRTGAASKLSRRVTCSCCSGTRKDYSSTGPPGRLVPFSKEVNSPTTGTAGQITRVIFNLEPGCNPVVPFSELHEALAGPARLTRSYGPSGNEVSVWLASTVFFRTHPPTAAQNYQ